ncbi:MAG TPA: tetratricopeptide repeat protein [Polyangiaceae bacterium]|nr:tetratricopeptide repeat protein [Polyangiaceae bacterium]
MIASEPSPKAVLIAIGGLVVVPAVCLIAVMVTDRSDPATSAAPENLPTADLPAAPQPAAPVVQAPPTPVLPQVQNVSAQHAVAANQDAAEKLSLARRVENSDPERSRELLREVLAKDPNNEQALQGLAAKTLADEDHEEARELAKRCAAVNSKNAICEKVAKLSPQLTPELERMATIVDQCVQADPNNMDCVYGRMQWFLMHGKVEEAEPIVEHLTELNPKAPLALMAQGRMKAAAGEYGDARKLLQAACDQGNKDACLRSEMLRDEGW